MRSDGVYDWMVIYISLHHHYERLLNIDNTFLTFGSEKEPL